MEKNPLILQNFAVEKENLNATLSVCVLEPINEEQSPSETIFEITF